MKRLSCLLSTGLYLACGALTAFGAGAAADPSRPQRSRSTAARNGTLKLHSYPEPDLNIDGFPVWLGADRKLDRVVVLVEGFDLFNRMHARDLLRMVSPVADELGGAGFDALVVDFPDSHLPPDELAPYLDRAIRVAAKASGQPVAVAGLSAGGLTARWTLCVAEERGEPLPVHTLLLLDTPNRGANLNPGLQALIGRLGAKEDREAITCPAADALLTRRPRSVAWKRVGPPLARRAVPAKWESDSSTCDAFLARLRGLNDRGGYPRGCRVVAVAQGVLSAAGGGEAGAPEGAARDLFRMWLPMGARWRFRSSQEDRAPGSLLPARIVIRFRVRMPLGIAGAYLSTTPTFVSTESALDIDPGETPRFDEWYARSAALPPIDHDGIDEGALRFVVRVLTRAAGGNAHQEEGL